MTDRPELPSLTNIVNVDQIDDSSPCAVCLKGVDEDLEALARFLDLPGIKYLGGEFITLKGGPLVTVKGLLKAELVRRCVVSLEEMIEEIEEDFVVTFTTEPPDKAKANEEVEADLEAPESLDGPELDLGDILIEQLVLSMDPHPRKEGAEPVEDPRGGEKISPFDVLKDLKSGDGALNEKS